MNTFTVTIEWKFRTRPITEAERRTYSTAPDKKLSLLDSTGLVLAWVRDEAHAKAMAAVMIEEELPFRDEVVRS